MNQNNALIEVYADTLRKTSGLKNDWSCEKFNIENIGPVSEINPKRVTVTNSDTVSTLLLYRKLFPKDRICILNMASYKRPGGGVSNGAQAQEECLFRCSNLTTVISSEFYPIQEGEFIYSTNVSFIKDANYADITPVLTDVITMPAINLNKQGYYDPIKKEHVDIINEPPKGYEQYTKAKMKAIFNVALAYEVDCLILGAWGCGVFKNKPEDISRMFKEVILEYAYQDKFKSIIFPVINDRNSRGNNYQIFLNTLNP